MDVSLYINVSQILSPCSLLISPFSLVFLTLDKFHWSVFKFTDSIFCYLYFIDGPTQQLFLFLVFASKLHNFHVVSFYILCFFAVIFHFPFVSRELVIACRNELALHHITLSSLFATKWEWKLSLLLDWHYSNGSNRAPSVFAKQDIEDQLPTQRCWNPRRVACSCFFNISLE